MMTEEFDPFASDYDTSDTDAEAAGASGGGGGVEKAGMYHMVVKTVTYEPVGEKNGKGTLPYFKVQLEVMAGEHESEVGKSVFQRLFLASWEDKEKTVMGPISPERAKQLLYYLYCFGTVGEEVWGNEKQSLDKDMFERLLNTQAIAKVTMSKPYTNPTTKVTYDPQGEISWPTDVWKLTDEKVKDVPKDMAIAGPAMAAEEDDLSDL